MALYNTIKVKQIDTNDFSKWLQSLLGSNITSGVSIAHSYNESFNGTLSCGGLFSAFGQSSFGGMADFQSGVNVDGNLKVDGNISGDTLNIKNFSLSSGNFGALNIGEPKITGIPIFTLDNLSSGISLPSGTVYGLRRVINAPALMKDDDGQLTPSTGLGITVTLLCVSAGY